MMTSCELCGRAVNRNPDGSYPPHGDTFRCTYTPTDTTRLAWALVELERTRQAWVDGEDTDCEDVCTIACKGPCGVFPNLSSAGRLAAGAGTPAPADETPRRWRYTVVPRTAADHRFNAADPADERTP